MHLLKMRQKFAVSHVNRTIFNEIPDIDVTNFSYMFKNHWAFELITMLNNQMVCGWLGSYLDAFSRTSLTLE